MKTQTVILWALLACWVHFAYGYDYTADCVFSFSPGWYITANSDHATHWEIYIEGEKRFEVPAFQTPDQYRPCWPVEFATFYETKIYPQNCIDDDNDDYCVPSGILAVNVDMFLLPDGMHNVKVRPMNFVIDGDEADFMLFIYDGKAQIVNNPQELRLVVIEVKGNNA